MIYDIHGPWLLFFVSARTNKDIIIISSGAKLPVTQKLRELFNDFKSGTIGEKGTLQGRKTKMWENKHGVIQDLDKVRQLLAEMTAGVQHTVDTMKSFVELVNKGESPFSQDWNLHDLTTNKLSLASVFLYPFFFICCPQGNVPVTT